MRVVVVAEDRLVRRGLAAVLAEAGVDVVAATAPADLDAHLQESEPDAVLADGVVEVADVPWVALVEEDAAAADARRQGAAGVLHREAEGPALHAALGAVLQELVVFDPLFVVAADEPGPMPGFEPLTPRESEVLEQLAMGLSNREIGEALGISSRTARFHVAAILDKLGAQTRTEAVVLAARAGLVVL